MIVLIVYKTSPFRDPQTSPAVASKFFIPSMVQNNIPPSRTKSINVTPQTPIGQLLFSAHVIGGKISACDANIAQTKNANANVPEVEEIALGSKRSNVEYTPTTWISKETKDGILSELHIPKDNRGLGRSARRNYPDRGTDAREPVHVQPEEVASVLKQHPDGISAKALLNYFKGRFDGPGQLTQREFIMIIKGFASYEVDKLLRLK